MAGTITFRRLPLRALKAGNGGNNPLPVLEPILSTYIRNFARGMQGPDDIFQALRWVPRCVTSLTVISLRNETVLKNIEKVPAAAFFTLIQNHEHRERFNSLANRLEASVQSDGELLALYLSWAQQMNFLLPHPIEEYRAAMMRDPIHGIRWALAMKDDSFATDLIIWASDHCHESSPAAWVHLVATGDDPEPFRPVLALNPMYAVAIAVHTGMKFAIDDFVNGLEPHELFHLLANQALQDPKSAEKQLLQSDPLWGIEWLLESGKSNDVEKQRFLLDSLRAWEEKVHPLRTNATKSLKALVDSDGTPERIEGDDDEDFDPEDAEEGSEGASPQEE